MFRRILVGYDGSAGAKQALLVALSLARECGAMLCTISAEGKLPRYAATIGEVEEAERERYEFFDEIQSEAKRLANNWAISLETVVLPGPPAETIVRYAREKEFDLIVLGHKHHIKGRKIFARNTAVRVTQLATCSILVVGERPSI